VFGEKEWEVLQDEELVALTREQQRKMREWDDYWRNVLDNIVRQRWFRLEHPTIRVSHVLIINEIFYSR
jgi:hypothetical protein